MDPAQALRTKRGELLALARTHGVRELRVFGSAAAGTSGAESDLDLLVELEDGRSLLDLIGFKQDAEELLGVRVDVLTPRSIHPLIREAVLDQAVPV